MFQKIWRSQRFSLFRGAVIRRFHLYNYFLLCREKINLKSHISISSRFPPEIINNSEKIYNLSFLQHVPWSFNQSLFVRKGLLNIQSTYAKNIHSLVILKLISYWRLRYKEANTFLTTRAKRVKLLSVNTWRY